MIDKNPMIEAVPITMRAISFFRKPKRKTIRRNTFKQKEKIAKKRNKSNSLIKMIVVFKCSLKGVKRKMTIGRYETNVLNNAILRLLKNVFSIYLFKNKDF